MIKTLLCFFCQAPPRKPSSSPAKEKSKARLIPGSESLLIVFLSASYHISSIILIILVIKAPLLQLEFMFVCFEASPGTLGNASSGWRCWKIVLVCGLY